MSSFRSRFFLPFIWPLRVNVRSLAGNSLPGHGQVLQRGASRWRAQRSQRSIGIWWDLMGCLLDFECDLNWVDWILHPSVTFCHKFRQVLPWKIHPCWSSLRPWFNHKDYFAPVPNWSTGSYLNFSRGTVAGALPRWDGTSFRGPGKWVDCGFGLVHFRWCRNQYHKPKNTLKHIKTNWLQASIMSS
jgi:hypothetical protein